MVGLGIWPREAPRATRSRAEVRVWEALRDKLPKGWVGWHSLRIQDRHGIDGEGDFVLASAERGLLVLEVKGGEVQVRDGRWLQNGRPMDKPPREQALRYVHKLVGALRERGTEPPAFGVATFFPDTSFDEDPSQGDVRGRALGAQDLKWLDEALPEVIERALPEARAGRGRWVDALHELWGASWTPRLKLGRRKTLDEAERVQLDARQLELLDMIEANERMLIDGVAGSGKTLVALEAARRLAQGGKRVLMLCFTQALARFLQTCVEGSGIEVNTVSGLAMSLVEQAGLRGEGELDAEAWKELSWKATELAPEGGWDAVILDEGQDFMLGDWALVEACAGDRRLWAFWDGAQAFWEDRRPPEHLFQARFSLKLAYRCPDALALVAGAWAGRELDEPSLKKALKGGQLVLVPCPSEAAVPTKLAREVDKLLSEGLRPEDIAIISLRGLSAKDSVLHLDKLGKHPLVRADDPALESNIVADTFLRFKGLERPAILITDLRLVEDRRDVRLHIALTRALLTARVIAPEEVLRADEVFRLGF